MYLDVINFLSGVVMLNVFSVMPLSCAYPQAGGFFFSLVARTAVPLALILMLALAGALLRRVRRDHPAAEVCSAGWFFLLFLVYPSCSSAAFSAFICDPLEDGTSMLNADYSVVCWQGEHLLIAAYALLMMIIYPFGTPCLYAAMIYANKEALDDIQSAEMRAGAHTVIATHGSRTGRAAPAEVSTNEISKDDAERQAAAGRKQLPAALQKLTAGYEIRCYWCAARAYGLPTARPDRPARGLPTHALSRALAPLSPRSPHSPRARGSHLAPSPQV